MSKQKLNNFLYFHSLVMADEWEVVSMSCCVEFVFVNKKTADFGFLFSNFLKILYFQRTTMLEQLDPISPVMTSSASMKMPMKLMALAEAIAKNVMKDVEAAVEEVSGFSFLVLFYIFSL